MASLRTRSVLLAAAVVAGTSLLTACQSDTGDKASPAAPASASSTEAAAEAEGSSGADSSADGSASSGTKAPAAEGGSSGTGKAGSGSSAPESAGDAAGQGKGGKGVSGTWFGNVSYLAPGKYTVSGPKGEQQAFFTSDATEIWGAGDICGDENGQSATKCTEQELEAAARKGVSAEVKVSSGIATRITDDH